MDRGSVVASQPPKQHDGDSLYDMPLNKRSTTDDAPSGDAGPPPEREAQIADNLRAVFDVIAEEEMPANIRSLLDAIAKEEDQ